jgi:hypothetical protein
MHRYIIAFQIAGETRGRGCEKIATDEESAVWKLVHSHPAGTRFCILHIIHAHTYYP